MIININPLLTTIGSVQTMFVIMAGFVCAVLAYLLIIKEFKKT